MKNRLYIILLIIFNNCFSQKGIFESGYEMNFLNQSGISEDLNATNYQLGLGITGNKTPLYFILTYSKLMVKDNIIESNKFDDNLGGITLGLRPFANIWFSRFQPIIQTSARMNFKKNQENQEIIIPKIQIYEGSTGFEFYLSSKLCLATIGSYQHWVIDNKPLQNYSGKVSLRFVF